MNVMIAVKNELFARMLSLEFTERGFTPSVVRTKNEMELALRTAHLALIDAAYLSEGPLPRFPFETVVLGYADELARIPIEELTRYYALTRPFAIDEFFDSIFEPDDKTRRLTLHIPKKKSPAEFLALDEKNRAVYFKGKKVELTKKEFALIALLYANRGTPVSRTEAMQCVFGESGEGTNVVDVYINYLRTKIDHPFGVRLIRTVRGKGYMIPSEENL